MTIKTLEYIHRLLIEEESRTHTNYNGMQNLQQGYKKSKTVNKKFMENLIAEVAEYKKMHVDAVNALEDFESAEWCREKT